MSDPGEAHMTAPIVKKRLTARRTWVEVQRERLERSSERTPGSLVPENGVGATLGGTAGLMAGLLVALAVILAASPMESGEALRVSLVAGLLGMVIGAVAGAVLFGRRADQARAEFQALREDAGTEAPVQFNDLPPVAEGPSVFDGVEGATPSRPRRR